MTRASLVLLILVLITPFLVVSPTVTPARAWGTATHNYIDTAAINALSNDSWRAAFDYYSPEVITGGAIPDQWQDWDNHLYYPETGEHNAPAAAAHWFEMARANFTLGNWEEGFFAAGVMSHYAVDPCIPVHTDEWWEGHPAYEHDINNHLQDFVLPSPAEREVTNVSQLVVDNATYAHQYYDIVYDAYPTSESTALDTNSTIWDLTVDCLSMAVNACTSLFYTLTIGLDAPDVTSILDKVAVIDYAHSNDYTTDKLTEIEDTLNRHGFEVRHQDSAFTAADLADVDLIIATCGLDEYTTAELQAISDWAASDDKGMLLAGRGDYSTYQDVARPNQILEAIGSNIRFNDDNVYMEGTYNPWYIDLYEIPAPSETLNLTFGVESMTFFSPASLYFLDERPVLPLIFCDPTGYQTDQNPPAPVRVYDDTQDGENGVQIPVAAVEEIGGLRLLVTGTTIFSNYDYSKDFDNIQFVENFLDWVRDSRFVHNISTDVDEIGPWIRNMQWTPSPAAHDSPITVTATVSDVSGVGGVNLTYTVDGTSATLVMSNTGDNTYSAEIPDQEALSSVVISITAVDGVGNVAIRASYTIEIGAATTGTTGTNTTTTETSPGGGPAFGSQAILIGSIGAVLLVLALVLLLRRRG